RHHQDIRVRNSECRVRSAIPNSDVPNSELARVRRAGVEPAQQLRVGYSHLGSPMPSRRVRVRNSECGIRSFAQVATPNSELQIPISEYPRWDSNPCSPP